jgi:hypothetical protein
MNANLYSWQPAISQNDNTIIRARWETDPCENSSGKKAHHDVTFKTIKVKITPDKKPKMNYVYFSRRYGMSIQLHKKCSAILVILM